MKAGRKLALNVSIRHILAAFFAVAGFLFVSFVFGAPTAEAAQTVPYKINFQGRLTNSSGNAMADGQYNVKFRLYSVASGGSPVWTELRETTNRVQVTNGLFSVQLGDVTALTPSVFTSYPLYFEVELPTTGTATCSTASCATFDGSEIMTPRRPLGASPYAMNADTLDGIDSATFARNDQANTFSGTQTFNSSLVLNNGSNNVTISSGATGSYALTLPTALGSSGDCLKQTNGTGALGFGTCGGGGTLQGAYDASGASPQIVLSNTNGGIKIKDNASAVSGESFLYPEQCRDCDLPQPDVQRDDAAGCQRQQCLCPRYVHQSSEDL
jgi:hypothetical protein